MSFGHKIRQRFTLVAATAALSLRSVPAQQTASRSDDTVAPSITVRASAEQFIAGFIATAVRLVGPKFLSCIVTATKMRPDLASKIVVSALNIAHLNSHAVNRHLSLANINQIITAAITGAPERAGAILQVATESEPYARESIIAAAIAVAPHKEAEILAAADQTRPIWMFALANAKFFNPVNNGGLDDVNSPEQPPSGP